METPAEVVATTFGEGEIDGRPVRMLYKRFGFVPLDEPLAIYVAWIFQTN